MLSLLSRCWLVIFFSFFKKTFKLVLKSLGRVGRLERGCAYVERQRREKIAARKTVGKREEK